MAATISTLETEIAKSQAYLDRVATRTHAAPTTSHRGLLDLGTGR